MGVVVGEEEGRLRPGRRGEGCREGERTGGETFDLQSCSGRWYFGSLLGNVILLLDEDGLPGVCFVIVYYR